MSVARFEEERREMIAAIRVIAEHLAAEIGKTALGDRVLRAMTKVPRHEFVPIEVQPYAYLNRPLPIGFDKTISQPLMVAVMTDLLELKPDDVVLEIGTASAISPQCSPSWRARCTPSKSSTSSRSRQCSGSTRRLHQRRGSRRKRLFRLARARAVRQGDRYSGTRSHSSSANQPAQGGRKDGDPGRIARCPAACRGR